LAVFSTKVKAKVPSAIVRWYVKKYNWRFTKDFDTHVETRYKINGRKRTANANEYTLY